MWHWDDIEQNTLEVDNILCKETVESGIDFVYKCGNNFNKVTYYKWVISWVSHLFRTRNKSYLLQKSNRFDKLLKLGLIHEAIGSGSRVRGFGY